MAKFLFLGKDIPHANRVKGDPVCIVEDTHRFSPEEDKREWIAAGNDPANWPGLFYVVELIGLPAEKARRVMDKLTRRATVIEPEYNNPDDEDRIVELGPHRWHIDLVQDLPPKLRDQLKNDGFISIQYTGQKRTTINSYFKDRLATQELIDP